MSQAKIQRNFYKYLETLQGILSGKNKVSALNIFATPSLAHAFGILSWTKPYLENVQRWDERV